MGETGGSGGGGTRSGDGGSRHGEKIFVSVRLRPLNGREIVTNDVSDWECVAENTIVYKNGNLSVPERSMYPSAYTFGKSFFWKISSSSSSFFLDQLILIFFVFFPWCPIGCRQGFWLWLLHKAGIPGCSKGSCAISCWWYQWWVSLFSFYYSFILLHSASWIHIHSRLQQFPASIFAYGQTSSGKTFTMTGITEYTLADIYDYVQKVINHTFTSSQKFFTSTISFPLFSHLLFNFNVAPR